MACTQDMRVVELREEPIRGPPGLGLQRAFDLVFGEPTLRLLHGDGLKDVSKWDDSGRRTLRFNMSVDEVPRELRTLFHGSNLRVTAKQQMHSHQSHHHHHHHHHNNKHSHDKDRKQDHTQDRKQDRTHKQAHAQDEPAQEHAHEPPKQIHVTTKMRMHFLGAELFKVRPEFSLREAEDGTIMSSARIEMHALLPPPICNIAEHFMAQQSSKQLEFYRACVLKSVEDAASSSSSSLD